MTSTCTEYNFKSIIKHQYKLSVELSTEQAVCYRRWVGERRPRTDNAISCAMTKATSRGAATDGGAALHSGAAAAPTTTTAATWDKERPAA